MESNFEKFNANTITSFGVPYDFQSIMHYDSCAFSGNGLPTIVPRVSQLLYLFLVSICGFCGRICGSSIKP